MLYSKVAFISDVRFLAITWDQGIFFNLVGGSGACGRYVTALTDWLDILSGLFEYKYWRSSTK
jgi:hypothetical protein